MEYSPARDIPKAVGELKTLSPKSISDWVRDNRTETDAFGKRHQKDITPESITMWFKRHPDIQKTLEQQLENELIPQEAISESLFQNGTFDKLPCIEKWHMELRGRNASETSIKGGTSLLKQVCLGQIPRTKQDIAEKRDYEYIEGWGLKHPQRLTLDDALRYISELKKRNRMNRNHRIVLRSFLASRNIDGWRKISGAMPQTSGKYAHLYAPPEKMREIFAWLKKMNPEVHDACFFAFKTACRTTATLEADAKYVSAEEKTIFVFEKAALHGEKRKQEKLLPQDLWELLQPRIQRGGKLFPNITENELTSLLRACFKEIIPDLANDIPMPFHFFRHQFAQHLLRATGWNYGLVARLGHWTVQVLERYYGKMDRKTAFESGKQILPHL